MWSVGCILSEMISCTEHYLSNGVKISDRFLFPGTSCFPLSPCDKMKSSSSKKNIVSKNDQLKVVLDILGDLDECDTSFISDESASKYVKSLNSSIQKIDFKREFPATTKEVLDIIEDTLQFNPHFRSRAGDLLKNKVFDSIRNPLLEQAAPYQINLEIDQTGSFDYDQCKSVKYSMNDFIRILEDEITIIRSMNLINKN